MTAMLNEARKLYPFRGLKYLYSDRKKPVAVQMDVEDFLGLMETLSIASNKRLMRSVKRGLRDIKERRLLYSHDEVFR
mgnify:FL=1